ESGVLISSLTASWRAAWSPGARSVRGTTWRSRSKGSSSTQRGAAAAGSSTRMRKRRWTRRRSRKRRRSVARAIGAAVVSTAVMVMGLARFSIRSQATSAAFIRSVTGIGAVASGPLFAVSGRVTPTTDHGLLATDDGLPHRQLPARRVDVLAPAAADGDGHALGHERADEPLQLGLGGGAEGGALDGVVHDEVHLARRPPRHGGEVPRVLVGVVEALEDAVLVGDAAPRLLVVVPYGLLEGREVGLLGAVDGHDRAPLRVRRRVEADGEAEGRRAGGLVVGELADAPGEAYGRDGDPLRGEAEALRQQRRALEDGAVVLERLAHPHVDHVGHAAPEALARDGVHGADLVHDLPGREVLLEAHEPRRAEVAPHRAADLGGDAHRQPLRRARRRVEVGDEHGLDVAAGGEAEKTLDRPVRGRLPAHLLDGADAGEGGEPLAQRPREVGHLPERRGALL